MYRPRFQPRRDGFTLVELLFALALIALLVSMLFLGAGYMVTGSKEKATKVTLSSLKGMLAEYDSKTRLTKPPAVWLWHEPGGTTTARTITSGDFWIVPARDPTSIPPNMPIPLDAPGLVTSGNYDPTDMATATSAEEFTRNGSRQVLNTQLVMGMILQMPANREVLAKIPPESYFVPRWVGGGPRLPAPESGDKLVPAAPPVPTEDVHYVQGMKVLTESGSFLCKAAGLVTSTTTPTPGGDWVEDRSPATPILLDAWNNPIIFVPGSGLRVRLLNGEPNYYDTKVAVAIVVSPEGKVDSTDPLKHKLVKEGRPFFASAGADGDFSKGDDNIYSFGQ